ncbi:MAG: 30S ribosomal protein S9, partial [Candidatus Omnitrophica bacterium CG12_big_fil_rev_8_21_14_0_65_42_8]
SRAIALTGEDLRVLLRKKGFLTRDPRKRERKKYGQKGARKKFQWTKR